MWNLLYTDKAPKPTKVSKKSVTKENKHVVKKEEKGEQPKPI